MATITVTYKLSNCTCNQTATTINTGTTYSFIVTANDGYVFNNAPVFSQPLTSDIAFTKVSDTVYKLERSFNTSYKNLTLTANAYLAVVPPPEYDMTFGVNLTHCTTNIIPGKVYHTVDDEKIAVKVTADPDYYFADNPYLAIAFPNGGTGNFGLEPVDPDAEFPTEFYANVKGSDAYLSVTITGNATVIPRNNRYGIINIYNPTTKEMKEIGDVRYIIVGGDKIIDLGEYITNLIRVFINVPKGNRAIVSLGGYTTDVEANVLIDDIVETDCGNVTIQGHYNNAMDYENTDVEIFLPFIGFQQLETKKVMGESLHLMYRTNIINGDSIACIYNTNGGLLYTFNCNVAFEVPYRINNDYEKDSKLAIDSNYLFGFTPFVTIRYNRPYNSTEITAKDDRACKLKELKGLVKCSEIFDTIRATNEEKREIETLLRQGIIM